MAGMCSSREELWPAVAANVKTQSFDEDAHEACSTAL